MQTENVKKLAKLLYEYEIKLNESYNNPDYYFENICIEDLTFIKNKIPYSNITEQLYEQYYRILHKYRIMNIVFDFDILVTYFWIVMFILVTLLGLYLWCLNSIVKLE